MMDDSKKRFRRTFLTLALGQLLVFAALGFAFYLLAKSTPFRADVAAATAKGEAGSNGAKPPSHTGGFLEEEAAVMFGAATVASTLTTGLLAILAIFSWTGIRDIVQQRVKESMQEYQKVDLARMKTRVGTLYGQLSQCGVNSEKFLDYAVDYLRQAYEETGKEQEEIPTLNNFAFYLSLQGKEADADEALKLGQKFRDLNLIGREEKEFLTTYGLLIGRYARSPKDIHPSELAQVTRLTQALLSTEKHRGQAERNLRLLYEAAQRLQAQPSEPPRELFKRWVRSLFNRRA